MTSYPTIIRPKSIPLLLSEGGGGSITRWNNLLAGWHFDEASAGSAPVTRADVLGVNDLTDNNTTASATGKFSNAANLVAANNEFFTRANFPAHGGAFTWSVWYKAASLGSLACILAKFGTWASTTTEYALYYSGGVWIFRIFSKTSGFADHSVATTDTTNWHNIVATHDDAGDGKVYLYFDGVLSGLTQNGSVTNVADTSTETLYMGDAKSTLANFNGLLDESHMFIGQKDAAWVTEMYNSGAGRVYPN